MRHLFLVAMLLLSPLAHAEKWLEGKNDAGGKILLTETTCSSGAGRVVIGTSGTGKSITGCWYYFTDMVHVVWSDGGTSSYEPSMFVYRESK